MFTIEMPKNYWKLLFFALETAKEFYSLNFTKGFSNVFEKTFDDNLEVNAIKVHSDAILKELFGDEYTQIYCDKKTVDSISNYENIFKSENGEYDLTDENLYEIINYLDFVIRIQLGQWGELQRVVNVSHYGNGEIVNHCYFMDDDIENNILKHRNQMFTLFHLNSNAFFGIYSYKIKDDVRILYGLLKALKFSISGNFNDTERVRKYDKPVKIKFPYVDEIVVENNEQAKKWLDKHPIKNIANQNINSYTVANGIVYVYVNDTISIAINPGTKIYACKNGCLEVERDGHLYSYNCNVI